jgi:asparagine synthase (glutamine-hydrolysing)
MRLIGGLVSWDPTCPVPVSAPGLMMSRAGGAVSSCAARGSVAFFSSIADGLESSDLAWAVADSDLTNLHELRALSGLDAHRTGLLVALYALEGQRFVSRLRGAFALALWDRRRRTLVLAVDHFGINRLYYTTSRGRTAFASRASALLGVPGVDLRVDPAAVYNYLNFGYVPAPASVFAGVQRLAPGQLLLVRDGQTTLETYWDVEYPELSARRRQSASMVYELTKDAVARTLRDTTPKETGAFLSGGTDSSTVVGLAAQITGERINAFSIGFQEQPYDELAYASLAARHFDAAHHVQVVTPSDALHALPRLVEAYDEPFGNNSAIGTLFCARLAADCGVTRLLAGDGGDEIFGGNERYRIDRIFARYSRIPAAIRRGMLEPVLFSLPDGGLSVLGRAQRYVRRASLPNPERFYSYDFFFAREGADLLDPDFRAQVTADAPLAVARAYYDQLHPTAKLNRLLYLDLKLTIGDNDLLKVTRTAELAGIDVRFPMLDLPLVEFTGTLPAHFKVRGLEKRHIFKRAFRALLPPAILAKRKHGFGVPTSVWLKSDPGFHSLVRDTLLSPRVRDRGIFRTGALAELLQLHATDVTPYHGDILWTVLMLELWYRRHVDGGAGL